MSSSLTWEDLGTLDLTPVADLVASWNNYATTQSELPERIRADIANGHLSDVNYDSDTAREVRQQLTRVADHFEDDLHDYAKIKIMATLEVVNDTLTTCKNDLTDLMDEVMTAQFYIHGGSGDEQVSLSEDLVIKVNDEMEYYEAGLEIDRLQQQADGLGERLRTIMSDARAADEEAAAVLGALRADPAPMPPLIGPGYFDDESVYDQELLEHNAEELQTLLDENVSPLAVNEWWTGMSDAERQALAAQHPELLGNTDGIPSDIRNDANRTILTDYVAEHPDDEYAANLLQTVKDDNLFLLGFEPPTSYETAEGDTITEDWKVITATGNPDTAGNIATLVPGTGADAAWDGVYGGELAKEGTGYYIDLAGQLASDANSAYPGSDTVAVMYLGYDAPNNLAYATGPGFAERGAEGLADFTTGLEATNQGEPNITNIGHSYGAVQVAQADQYGTGSSADSVVLIGSPGAGEGVDTADDFRVGEDNVYVLSSDGDPINAAGASGVHGSDVNDPSFGGTQLEAGEGNHMSYFDPQSDAYANLIEVISGNAANAARDQ